MNKDDYLITASGVLTWLVVTIIEIVLGSPPRFVVGLMFAYLFVFLWISFKVFIAENGYFRQFLMYVLMVISWGIYHYHYSSVMPIIFVVWAAIVPDHFKGKQIVAALAICNLGIFYFMSLKADSLYYFIGPVTFLVFQIFAVLSTNIRIQAIKSKKSLEHANMELVSAQSLLKQSGEQNERLRIARDLHDSIGQKLTSIILSMEYATHKPPSDMHNFISRSREDLSNALVELRGIVTEERQQDYISLSDFTEELIRTLPPNVKILYPSTIEIKNYDLCRDLMFIFQEAINNALKHGRADTINVQFMRTKDQVEISFHDNGVGCRKWAEGNGIKGIRERLLQYAGEVKFCQSNVMSGACLIIKATDNHKVNVG